MNVSLRPAFAWDCEECGRENFSRAVRPEFSPEDLGALREEHGVEPGDAGEFLVAPLVVECSHCGAEFDATDDRSELG